MKLLDGVIIACTPNDRSRGIVALHRGILRLYVVRLGGQECLMSARLAHELKRNGHRDRQRCDLTRRPDSPQPVATSASRSATDTNKIKSWVHLRGMARQRLAGTAATWVPSCMVARWCTI
jgi:hypothetical protein